jgi:hypothetical protein
VPEPVAGHVVEPHLDHEFGSQRLPFAAAPGAPAARAAGRFSSEAGRLAKRLQPAGQRAPFGVRDRRGEADVIELAIGVVETEQQ